MTREHLIAEIEAFARAQKIAPATVTSRGVGNSRLYARLKAGKSCTLGVAERLRVFMTLNTCPAATAFHDLSLSHGDDHGAGTPSTQVNEVER